MTTRHLAIGILGLTASLLGACVGSAPGEVPGEVSDDTGACSAKVTIGLYKDDRCAAGEEVLKIELDTSRECSAWSRSTGTGTRDNSATRFQCYRDRLCYTQHPGSPSCGAGMGGQTDKESRDTCLKDETPGIWTRLLGGTEDCPVAPAGFQCPVSEPGRGTPGLQSACPGA